MSHGDDSLDEKRVYADRRGATTLYVASSVGVARVSVSGDVVGEFALERREEAGDVAVAGGRLAVATPVDVLVETDDGFVETGFGPAEAVGYHEGLVAAGDGRVARYDDGWSTLGSCDDVRAIDGDMLAAASGVHSFDGTHVGLEDARDVATAGGPLAATASGLYYLANGWKDALPGSFRVVSSAEDGVHAHAATADDLYERVQTAERRWTPVDLPVEESVVDIAYGGGRGDDEDSGADGGEGDRGDCGDRNHGEDGGDGGDGGNGAIYAVTESGTLLAEAGDGWRYRSLGLPEARSLAIE